jgi:hypothetical protein
LGGGEVIRINEAKDSPKTTKKVNGKYNHTGSTDENNEIRKITAAISSSARS